VDYPSCEAPVKVADDHELEKLQVVGSEVKLRVESS
jgi:hypothetical protein